MSARDSSVSPPPAKRFRRLISVAATQAKPAADDADDMSVYWANEEEQEEQEEQELFLYQEQCLDWMEGRKERGGLVYLEPGMGKTLIALEWIRRMRLAAEAGKPWWWSLCPIAC